ncbi:MAG TPA: right-handed parallel beta-helix repeat-containing protein, partial [Armatimonadota bacterium]|nr:right-handed parallel beta-helix repeat-containing protein [Armatimonadota bacterium]
LQMWGASPTVRNSMITTHGYSGIVTQLASAPTISGVTVAGNDTGIYTGNSNMTLVNSIVSANRLGINAGGTNNPVIRHSCVHTNRNANFTGIADPGTANGNIQQNPLFQNPTAGNYRLMNGSPCVDAGDDSVLTDGQLDLAGIARKQGTHVDMGAWEIPVAGAYSWSDVRDALRVAGGLLEPSPAQYTRLNVVSDSRVNLLDAVRLGRKVSGLEPNQ